MSKFSRKLLVVFRDRDLDYFSLRSMLNAFGGLWWSDWWPKIQFINCVPFCLGYFMVSLWCRSLYESVTTQEWFMTFQINFQKFPLIRQILQTNHNLSCGSLSIAGFFLATIIIKPGVWVCNKDENIPFSPRHQPEQLFHIDGLASTHFIMNHNWWQLVTWLWISGGTPATNIFSIIINILL